MLLQRPMGRFKFDDQRISWILVFILMEYTDQSRWGLHLKWLIQPTCFILYCKDESQIMCKSIGQPSPHLPFLPSPNCSSWIVQTESYQHQPSQRPQLASSYPLLGGPSKAGKGLTFSAVQVVCFTCSRNSKFWERLSLLCMHFIGGQSM